jgi:hypothetical protein
MSSKEMIIKDKRFPKKRYDFPGIWPVRVAATIAMRYALKARRMNYVLPACC